MEDFSLLGLCLASLLLLTSDITDDVGEPCLYDSEYCGKDLLGGVVNEDVDGTKDDTGILADKRVLVV